MKMCKKTMVSKLPYISLGLLFVFAGIMKLFIISPAAFAGMIEMYFGMIGLVGGVAVFVAWLIAIAELLGGVCLLFWKFVPRMISKTLIIILALVMFGAIVFVHVRGGDLMSALKDLVLFTLLVSVLKTHCCGMTKAEKESCCTDETCTDESCKA
jgi:uncharacterized membrane protein YphA (DoxX/SURF4 family)